MSVQGIYKKYSLGCGTCLNLTSGDNNAWHADLMFLVNFGQVSALFLGALIVDSFVEYFLFIVNVVKCYLIAYLRETPNRRYIYGSCCKTLACTCALWVVLQRYLSISCYDDLIFIILLQFLAQYH